MATEPLSGTSSMLMQRSRVDLPEPDEPISETPSPSRAENEMPLSTSSAPKDLCRSRIATTGHFSASAAAASAIFTHSPLGGRLPDRRLPFFEAGNLDRSLEKQKRGR